MNWLYPKVKHLKQVILTVIFGALSGGFYGAIHDQFSYSISPEYFTKFKFHQFQYLDFGLPDRVFVLFIGFLAVASCGIIVGWFLGRIRFYSENLTNAKRDILKGFIMVLIATVTFGIIGLTVGYLKSIFYPFETFMGWEKQLTKIELQNIAIIGYLHNSEYLGGLVGLIIAIFYQNKYTKNDLNKKDAHIHH